MNKRTKVLAIGSAILLCSAIGYRYYNSQVSLNADLTPSINRNEVDRNHPSQADNTIVREPIRGRIAQSIDSLARQIVLDAPNQEETYTFLVEAKSYRIQDLRARRAKGKAEESKASYDSEYWRKKISQIDSELAKDIEKDSIDTQAGISNAIQNSTYQSNRDFEHKPQLSVESKNKISLDNFVLRAILKDGSSYVARLSYGERRLPAKKGYKLLGKVTVKSVTSDEVILALGDNEVTLYTY